MASSPVELTLTRVVSPSFRSRTKMSSVRLWSFGTRFGEAEKKATKRPVAESAGTIPSSSTPLPRICSAPVELTLTRVVLPRFRSRTKKSAIPLWSFGTRFVEREKKATTRPLSEIAGNQMLPSFASAPVELTSTRVVLPSFRSWTKTSKRWFGRPGPGSRPKTRRRRSARWRRSRERRCRYLAPPRRS